MRKAFLLLAIFLLPLAGAFSAEFAGQKQYEMCACQVAQVAALIHNPSSEQVEVSVEASSFPPGLQVLTEKRTVLDPHSTAIHDVYVKAECTAEPGFRSLSVRATSAEQEASDAGAVEIIDCGKLEFNLASSTLGCDYSEYDFVLKNAAPVKQNGVFEAGLLEQASELSQGQFVLEPGQSTTLTVRVKNISERDLGRRFAVKAKTSEGGVAVAGAVLAKTCISPTPRATPEPTLTPPVEQQGSGPGGFTGLFTSGDSSRMWRALAEWLPVLAYYLLYFTSLMLTLLYLAMFFWPIVVAVLLFLVWRPVRLFAGLESALAPSYEFLNGIRIALANAWNSAAASAGGIPLTWMVLAAAIILLAIFYFFMRALEKREEELDRRVLAR